MTDLADPINWPTPEPESNGWVIFCPHKDCRWNAPTFAGSRPARNAYHRHWHLYHNPLTQNWSA